jgi:hypothetical protein
MAHNAQTESKAVQDEMREALKPLAKISGGEWFRFLHPEQSDEYEPENDCE